MRSPGLRVSAASWPRGGEGLIHDAPNGACAPPALSAATEAMVNLPGRARNVLARRQRRTHVIVGENVARADDHCGESPGEESPGRESPCENWSKLKPSIKRNGLGLGRHFAFAIYRCPLF